MELVWLLRLMLWGRGSAQPRKDGICGWCGRGVNTDIRSCPSSPLPKATQPSLSLCDSGTLGAAILHWSPGWVPACEGLCTAAFHPTPADFHSHTCSFLFPALACQAVEPRVVLGPLTPQWGPLQLRYPSRFSFFQPIRESLFRKLQRQKKGLWKER